MFSGRRGASKMLSLTRVSAGKSCSGAAQNHGRRDACSVWRIFPQPQDGGLQHATDGTVTSFRILRSSGSGVTGVVGRQGRWASI